MLNYQAARQKVPTDVNNHFLVGSEVYPTDLIKSHWPEKSESGVRMLMLVLH